MKRNPLKHENLIAFLHRIEFFYAFHCSTLKPTLLLGSDYGKKKITQNEIPTPFQIALPNIRQAAGGRRQAAGIPVTLDRSSIGVDAGHSGGRGGGRGERRGDATVTKKRYGGSASPTQAEF